MISRGALSLAHIVFNNRSEAPQPLLFSAYIWSLEREEQIDSQEPLVLIVQDEENSLAVVEKVSKGIYTLLWLAKWVALQDLDRRPAKRCRLEAQVKENATISTGHWWQSAAARIPPPPPPPIDDGQSTDSVLANKSPVQDQPTESLPKKVKDVSAAMPQSSSIIDNSISTQAEPIDWVLKIREHYLEALYASRAPLAYFVKGPLSRARMAYQTLNQDRDLADLLRAGILPVKIRSNMAVIDKKYNKGVLDVINEVPSGMTLEETSEIVGLSQDRASKSRRRKKITPEGLLPGEEEYVLKWWIKREVSIPHEGLDDTREQRIRRAIIEQKFRETQLQIIMILEAMALEAQCKPSEQEGVPNTKDATTQPSASKEKKPLELGRALDMLVEKLQIWETMDEDTIALSINSREKFSENGNSCLRAFCLDIILPFYISRLPDVSKDFCRKFGVVLSPEKKATRITSSSKTKNKRGDPPKDRPSRKPLDRVLTSERVVSKRRPASLARSATDSLVPFIKEELQEVSLTKLPVARQSIHQSKFYARREVDLTAEVKATEAKLKRKAEIEQQLKGAIFALKKPNARLAVKEYVDSSDQRKEPQKGRPRKSQNPTRNPFAAGVQVTATPRISRYKSHTIARYELPSGVGEGESEISPPSSVPLIPSSTKKPLSQEPAMFGRPAVSYTPTKAAKALQSRKGSKDERRPIRDQTPSLIRVQPATNHDFNNLESEPELPCIRDGKRVSQLLPLGPQSSLVNATPIKRASLTRIDESTSEDNLIAIFTTPRRSTPPSSATNLLVSSPLVMRHMTNEVVPSLENNVPKDKGSIYDVLGWDNEFDI